MTGATFFLKLFIRFSFRHLRNHRGRAIAVLIGIALGASVFTSVRLAVHASLEAFSNSMDLIAGRAQRVVVQPAGRVPESLVPRLAQLPAVRNLSPLLSTYIQPTPPDGDPFLLIGVDPLLDSQFRGWQPPEIDPQNRQPWLALLRTPHTFLASDVLLRENNWKTGEYVPLHYQGRQTLFRVVGSLGNAGMARAEGGRIALTDIATFQEFTRLHGALDRIDLQLREPHTEEDLAQIRAILPEGVQLSPPGEAKATGRRMIYAYQINLSILSFASLFVGMFLIYSLVALNAASRRHELAVLRSLGASPGLLFRLFLAEGCLFGMIGWLLAIPVSTVLVKYLLHGVSQTISTLFVRIDVQTLSISAGELLLSFGSTLLVSVLAACQPAREAMQVAPKEAMAMAHYRPLSRRVTPRLALAGLALIALGGPLSKFPGPPGFPFPGYLATFFLFFGFALLTPWILQLIGKQLPKVMRRVAGEPAYLAAKYIRDSGTRSAISVGALITAVALFTSLVIMVHSFRETVQVWVHQTISGDLFVRSKMAEINRYRDPLAPETVDALRQLTPDADLVPYRRFYLQYESVPYHLEAMDFISFAPYGRFAWLQGDPVQGRPRLFRGEGVLVSEVFANQTGLQAGDRFTAQIASRHFELPIIGVIRDYRTQGGVVFYSLYHINRQMGQSTWSGVRFFFKNRNQDLAAAASQLRLEMVKQFGDRLEITLGRELRQSILDVFDETFALTTVLLLIALVVAALGITTTLTVLVLERTVQLNTLLAVGASHGQVRRMIFWEASFLVVVGELAGLLCGFLLSYLLVFVINRQSFGWTFVYQVDWNALWVSLPLILATALLAALPASQVAFREPPATLLRE
jgi:putative ABC transport system permease protein